MASVINTNTLSMVTQQNLSKSQNDLNTSMERLSSGLRINSAKDDAAGQAIANRMDAQITGLSQAQRNANDGISIAQTAEGALNQVNDNLQRIRELTVQAQNGTNSASDIDSIQQEVNLRLEEINRISEETDFNGSKILSGTDVKNIGIQVGSEDNQQINIEMQSNLGWNKYDAEGTVPTEQVNNEDRKVEALGFDVLSKTSATISATGIDTLKSDNTGAGKGKELTAPEVVSYTNSDGNTAYALKGGTTESAYNVTFDTDGNATIGEELSWTDKEAADSSSATISESDSLTLTVSSNALETLDNALEAVDTQRSALGAVQNRFDSAITNLATTETNLASAQSRIQDADYAEEVSSMTTAQILQQAGTSMLTQANQVPQNVLSLLG
ncbi:FliC/FljB family flagellin [Cobetia sp. 29-18-1]|uniref:FliC/FljB family flagellin n=1 Tax=Cobetia sp. 29-18-1 TaxID=3040018 RepID=UPI00244BABA1|nr:FliC/FljB family flagellin [Cobetia sp. 29-18-1]MDH2299102.1 FliC/FljB family flagellin [Cobetia sp. 29-18-1]